MHWKDFLLLLMVSLGKLESKLPRTSRGCLKLGPTQRKAKLREVVGQILKDHLRGTAMVA